MPEELKTSETISEKETAKPKAVKKAKTFLNKVIIRKLPPNLTSEDFLEIISPVPEICDFYFVRADWSLGAEATSRAYIEFKNQEDIFIFKDKFDEYVFVDNVRGTEYPAIVEFAPFQSLPKSRARKDKHVNTIESEQHYLNFLDALKKAEESENQKVEPKLEYSYQIKDDKKITSTPLLEFLAAAKEEKREAKKRKIEDKKKAREEEKQKKKVQIAKNIPEPIKETKEEIIYGDGVVVRTVPSRLGRNDKGGKGSGKEPKSGDVGKSDKGDKDREGVEKERREKKEREREERKKIQREKEDKRKQERAKERDAQRAAKKEEKRAVAAAAATAAPTAAATATTSAPNDESQKKSSQREPKKEVKRYSELRKARQEKTADPKETTTTTDGGEKEEQASAPQSEDVSEKSEDKPSKSEDSDDPRWKRIRELREKREQKKEEIRNERAKAKSEKKAAAQEKKGDNAGGGGSRREKDDRAQRQIRNKDRPALQIYRPKRVSGETETKPDGSMKSSDENSESNRRGESKGDKKSSRRSSRDESYRKKKTSRKNSSNSNGDEETAADASEQRKEPVVSGDAVTEKFDKMSLGSGDDKEKEVKSNENENE